jgi:hypothetical protein
MIQNIPLFLAVILKNWNTQIKLMHMDNKNCYINLLVLQHKIRAKIVIFIQKYKTLHMVIT